MYIHASAYSDVGKIREANEDCLLVADLSVSARLDASGEMNFDEGSRGYLLAVADGMGGAAGGELASHLGLQTLYEETQLLIHNLRHPDAATLESILMDAVGAANECIFEMSCERRELAGMGTTLTAILGCNGRLAIGQIGDSRAYLLRDNGIRQLTRDQSLVAERVSIGEITEEEARFHPQRNVLLQALGVKPEVELSLKSTLARPGDVFLLCTDGLYVQVPAGEIYDIVVDSPSPRAACKELVRAANHRGGPDNITVVLVQFA